jgi:hypothetical protein
MKTLEGVFNWERYRNIFGGFEGAELCCKLPSGPHRPKAGHALDSVTTLTSIRIQLVDCSLLEALAWMEQKQHDGSQGLALKARE